MSMTADARSGNSPTWACDGVVGFQGTATFGARPRNQTLLTLAFRRGPLGCCPRKTPGHDATLPPTKTNSRLFKSFPCRKNWGTLFEVRRRRPSANQPRNPPCLDRFIGRPRRSSSGRNDMPDTRQRAGRQGVAVVSLRRRLSLLRRRTGEPQTPGLVMERLR